MQYYVNEDFCENCADDMKRQGRMPCLIITLPERTSAQDLEVRVCPNCDGSAAELGMRYA